MQPLIEFWLVAINNYQRKFASVSELEAEHLLAPITVKPVMFPGLFACLKSSYCTLRPKIVLYCKWLV